MTLGAIILAGGRSERMGRDKATIPWGPEIAVHRVARLARDLGSAEIMVSGGNYGLPFLPDRIAHAGPVGGLLDVAATLSADRFLVLAVDAPTLEPADLAPLLDSGAPGAAFEGFPLPMVIFRSAIPARFDRGAPLKRFVEAAGLRTLSPSAHITPRLRGANTPQDLDVLRAHARPEVL